MIINENDQKKPTITTTVSYGLVVIISGLLLFSEAVSQFDDGFDMSYYEFALIVVFLQALMGAARFAFRNEKSCTVESWYEILSFLRKTVVLPFVAYELYTYNDIEEGYFHILAMAVPVLMMLLCMMNYINMAVSVIILGSLITLIGQGFINSMPFGITAGIVYFIIHFLVQEHCFVLCDHSKDIYNLGIALFLILMFRAITANDGAPWLQWIFGVFYHL